ncbi:CPBP family intramembrane glutamic endopeptidase [Mariniluteicoccus flavus]
MTTHTPPLAAAAAPTKSGAAVATTVVLMVLRVGLLGAAAATCFAFARALDPSSPADAGGIWMNLAIVVVDVVCLVTLASVLGREGSSVRRLLSSDRPGRDALWGLGLFVPIAIAFFAATFVGNLVAYRGAPPAAGAMPHVPLGLGLVSLIVMPATVAVVEEALYRAYALPRLGASVGKVGAVVISATLFGLQHVFFAIGSPQEMIARFVTTFLAGLAFGALWFRIGRVWPLIVAHWLLDVLFLGVPMLMLAMGA